MFLFATPQPTRQAPSANPVVDAIRQGAERTGTGFDYLLATAKRESALDPTAKASTSSATGLFQFIEQTWLGIVKREGDRVGLGAEAGAITGRADGGFVVADPAARQAILKLREDPQVAAVMAGALTQQNREALMAATGREPSAGELYMAHVLGARGASELIAAAGSNPNGAAATVFPEAARANRGIFYERGGRARGSAEVYAVLAGAQAGNPVPERASEAAATAPAGTGLQGMFQTGSRSGPISDAVAKIWRVNNEGARTRTAALSFFPRTRPLDVVSDAAPAAVEAAAPVLVESAGRPARSVPDVPLPPARPNTPATSRAKSGGPLDLTSFMRGARS